MSNESTIGIGDEVRYRNVAYKVDRLSDRTNLVYLKDKIYPVDPAQLTLIRKANPSPQEGIPESYKGNVKEYFNDIANGREVKPAKVGSGELKTAEGILTEEEITKAWGNANFGSISKRDVILNTLKKVAQAWWIGRTALCIVRELGLVEPRNGKDGLSDKGLKYLLEEYATQQRGLTKEDVKEIASIAWMGAANAHRMYPDNKHTFSDYWTGVENQFDKFLLPAPPKENSDQQ